MLVDPSPFMMVKDDARDAENKQPKACCKASPFMNFASDTVNPRADPRFSFSHVEA